MLTAKSQRLLDFKRPRNSRGRSKTQPTPARKVDRTEDLDFAVKLAWSLSSRWKARIPYPELKSIAGMALVDASESFDEERGVNFRTLLYYHVRGLLIKEIAARATYQRRIAFDQEVVTLDLNPPEKLVMRKEFWEEFTNSGLKPIEREILVRSIVYGQTLTEIARETGYCRCHVSRLKHESIGHLREKLANLR